MTLTHATERRAPPSHLLYLHGFRSSPRSVKARRLQSWLATRAPSAVWWCPQLPPSPRAAMALLQDGVRDWPAAGSAVIGSSLGGFYATVLAEQLGWPAVLLNPAIDPARDLAAHLGTLQAWHAPQETFEFRAEHLTELRGLSPPELTRMARYLPIVAKGDELLDWRETCARYAGAAVQLIDGSDHALSDFDRHLPQLASFLNL